MQCPNCHVNIYPSRLTEYQAILTETHHLKELRTTNDPASAGDTGFVHNELFPAIENDRKILEKRISELRVAVETLVKEKHALAWLVDEIKSLISPRRRLPPEILMEIFDYTCAGEWGWETQNAYFHKPEPPYILTHVCRDWRQVALSCPSLWSRFSHYTHARHSQSFNDALDMQLSRSGSFPLCIQMAVSQRGYEAAAQAFLERVSAHSSRWRALRLSIGSTFADTAFKLLRTPYPLLKRLEVDIHKDDNVSVPNTGLSRYPSLRTIVLHDSRMIATDLPWAQITTLLLSDTFSRSVDDVNWYYTVLGQCPSLQTLVIHPQDMSDLQTASDLTFTISLEALKCLETSFPFIMDHLFLPRLKIARLSTSYGQRHFDSEELKNIVPSFQRLIRRSMCATRIHSLHLTKLPLTKEVLSLLSLTPSLVTLNIRAKVAQPTDAPEYEPIAVQTVSSLFDMLEVRHGEDTAFLPQLQHLSISLSRHLDKYSFPYLRDKDQEHLVRTLQSRWKVGTHSAGRLKTFEYKILARFLADVPQLTLVTEAALRLLEDEGMRISIRVRSKLVESDKLYLVDFGRLHT